MFFQRHVALPSDYGSWVLFLAPLVIGLSLGGRWHTTALYLVVAAGCGFLIRQPVTLAIKVYAGRRPRDTLPAACFWVAVYGVIGLTHVAGLVMRGFGYLLYLAIPGVLVFVWHLLLVARREERRQWLVEMLATGVLALTAPAGLWAGQGYPDRLGWFVWLALWAHSATAIAYAYTRLEQRGWKQAPAVGRRIVSGGPSIALAAASVILVAALGVAGVLPRWVFLAYLLQLAEVVRGIARPAIGVNPRRIGLRQLTVSVVFAVLFLWTWRL